MSGDGFDPLHPAVRMKNLREAKTPENVTALPNMGVRRFRVAKNKLMDAMFGAETAQYKQPFEEPQKEESEEPVTRNDNLETGMSEASITSMGKYKENRDMKRMMEQGEE